jgi:ATP-dependent helicase/nuclease subunit B
MVETGFSPQLTLTAAILLNGGFPDLRPQAGRPDLSAGQRPQAGRSRGGAGAGGDSEHAAFQALDGLRRPDHPLDDPAQPYPRAPPRSS